MASRTQPLESHGRPPVLGAGHTLGTITDKITGVVLTQRAPLPWYLGVLAGLAGSGLLAMAVTYLFYRGVGIWGVTIPIAWGFAIVNFVWWIGIGHAGTLISAILLLLKQPWRNSINRFAEAMTLFAVACAGMFPVLHLGRPWLAYWLFPYPSTMTVWPQFRSPLIWDVFAVSTYGTISLVFWYTGLIPDLATMRDQAQNVWAKRIYGVLCMGWRGSARHWKRYQSAYLLLAGLSTPLVLSVHTVVSFDFAISQLPGWHTTIFPPYFVAGAIYSGFAMVLVLAIPVRSWYGLKDLITERHLDNSAKVMLATGWIVAYGYFTDFFYAWYGPNRFERYMAWNRAFGPYGWAYWFLIASNIVIPQLLWFPAVRKRIWALFLISIDILIGMWLERFVIVIVSLHRDFLPSSWGIYVPTRWDRATFIGTLGFFTLAFFLFLRVAPSISAFEMREMLHHKQQHPEPAEVKAQ
jgi:molybdopterin-containing oxidoreductase family membrane subunit